VLHFLFQNQFGGDGVLWLTFHPAHVQILFLWSLETVLESLTTGLVLVLLLTIGDALVSLTADLAHLYLLVRRPVFNVWLSLTAAHVLRQLFY